MLIEVLQLQPQRLHPAAASSGTGGGVKLLHSRFEIGQLLDPGRQKAGIFQHPVNRGERGIDQRVVGQIQRFPLTGKIAQLASLGGFADFRLGQLIKQ